MSRRGMALVATLWLVVALSGVTMLGLSVAQRGIWTARNRVWQFRTSWAHEACWSIVRGRHAAAPARSLDTPEAPPEDLRRTELGHGLWCEAVWEDPGQRLNLNTAPVSVLLELLRDPERVAAVLDWRDPDLLPRPGGAEHEWYAERRLAPPRDGPFAAVAELRLVRGFDSLLVTALDTILTVRNARLDLNTAPLPVLRLLPGIGDEVLAVIAARRSRDRRITGWSDLVPALSPSAAVVLAGQEAALLPLVGFESQERWITIRAGIHGTPFGSERRLTIVPAGRWLAVVQAEVP